MPGSKPEDGIGGKQYPGSLCRGTIRSQIIKSASCTSKARLNNREKERDANRYLLSIGFFSTKKRNMMIISFSGTHLSSFLDMGVSGFVFNFCNSGQDFCIHSAIMKVSL